MSLLIDTHVWVWVRLDPDRLGGRAQKLIMDDNQQVYVSTISTLELARLAEARQVVLPVTVPQWVASTHAFLGFGSLELSHDIAAHAYALPGTFHRDPVDRVLVATARIHQLTLLTADARILAYPHVKSLDARL